MTGAAESTVCSDQHRLPLEGMRLIFVNRFYYPDVSATSQMLFDLTRRLIKLGASVHVVTSRMRYDDPTAILKSVEVIEGVQVVRVRTTRCGRGNLAGRAIDYLSFYITSACRLLLLARRGDVLIAKTDPPMISVVVALVARLRGAKLINWLQDLFPEVASYLSSQPLPCWLDRSLRAVRDWSLRVAVVNVAIGHRMKARLIQGGISESRVRVIENWADGEYIEPLLPANSRLRTHMGLQSKFVVGYSGNLGRAHEFETLLEAATLLKEEADIVFLMIGGGNKMQQLQHEVLSRNLSNFRFLPYQPREAMSDSMAAADVHLISLLPVLEGLIVPSKVYGILAAGRPAIFIGDPQGEVSLVIGRQHCGITIQCHDHEQLAIVIRRLQYDFSERERLGLAARRLFLDRYSAGHGAAEWSMLLQAICQEV